MVENWRTADKRFPYVIQSSIGMRSTAQFCVASNCDPLDLVQRDFVAGAVI